MKQTRQQLREMKERMNTELELLDMWINDKTDKFTEDEKDNFRLIVRSYKSILKGIDYELK